MTSAESNRPRSSLADLRIKRPVEPVRTRGTSRWFRHVVVVLLLFILVGGAAILAARNNWVNSTGGWFSLPEAMQAKPEVRLAQVSVEAGQAADATVVASGYLESRRQAKIGARAPGRIQVVNVEEGSRVETNQVLAVLEHADLEASLAAVRATLVGTEALLAEHLIEIERKQADFERAERMHRTNTISESEYDRAKFDHQSAVAKRDSLAANVLLATARVREAEQMKENMFIRAPFDGTVISKDAEVGESILPGGMGEASGRGSVVTIADLDHLEVDCDVKEDYISRVKIDQAAEVVVDAVQDRRYRGRVRKVIPMGDRARATIKVKVAIVDVDARLFPDMSSTVYFLPPADAGSEPVAESDHRPRVFCDSAAIVQEGEESYVWALSPDDRLQRIEVQLGPARDERTEVLAGLTGSERVVVAPRTARANQLVKLLQ